MRHNTILKTMLKREAERGTKSKGLQCINDWLTYRGRTGFNLARCDVKTMRHSKVEATAANLSRGHGT